MRPHFVLLAEALNQFASPYSHGDYSAQISLCEIGLMETRTKNSHGRNHGDGIFFVEVSNLLNRELTRSFILSQVLPGVSPMFLANWQTSNTSGVRAHDPEAHWRRAIKPPSNELCQATFRNLFLLSPTYQNRSGTIGILAGKWVFQYWFPVAVVSRPEFLPTDASFERKGRQAFFYYD